MVAVLSVQLQLLLVLVHAAAAAVVHVVFATGDLPKFLTTPVLSPSLPVKRAALDGVHTLEPT